MKNKLIIIMSIIFLISCFFVSGITANDYKPSGWLCQSWEGPGGGDCFTGGGGILYNFWHSFDPFVTPNGKPNPGENADIYGWYNHTFFGLFEWEREVCLMDLAIDVHNVMNVVDDSQLQVTSVYTTTITITATRDYGTNESNYLYEASWYIMPFNNDAWYRVHLTNGNDNTYIKGKEGSKDEDWIKVSKDAGDSGYYADYLNGLYTTAVLEYRDYGSQNVNIMNVTIVNKVYG